MDTSSDGEYDYYEPDVVSASDYYPFGMQMVGRTLETSKYRYGFNGKEKDNELKGEGNTYNYGMRVQDPRLGKFFSVDPISKQYPALSTYQYANNNPLSGVDLDGLELLKLNSSMFRSAVINNKPPGYKSPYPFYEPQPLISRQTITVVSSNVSSRFKSLNGDPRFSAQQAGLIYENFTPNADLCSTCPNVAGKSGLRSRPPWPWGIKDVAEGLEPSSSLDPSIPIQRTQTLGGRTNWYYWDYKPSNVVSPTISVQAAGTEGMKYVNLISNDIPLWKAYGKLDDHGRAIHRAIKEVSGVFESQSEPSNWFNGVQNKTDLTNFILDGTLQSAFNINSGGPINNYREILKRRLNIQFYGIQVLRNIGELRPETISVFESDVESYEKLYPDGGTNWRSIIKKE